MKFYVKETNGPARIGDLLINKKLIKSPNILFLNTIRFKAPKFADVLISNRKIDIDKPCFFVSKQFVSPKDVTLKLHIKNIKQKNKYYVITPKIEFIKDAIKNTKSIFFIISNSFQLLNNPKEFVDFIIRLRQKIGYQKIIYLPTVGKPTNLALFSYLGIDFFDSLSAIVAARNNILFFPNGEFKKEELNEISCNCPTCVKLKIKPSEMKFKDILSHNYYALFNEIIQVRNAIYYGNIRNLVENRVKVDPKLTTILRNLDLYHYDYLEKRTSVTNKNKVIATNKESLLRPEIKRYQKRIIDRYKKPDSAKVLLLLPCSAKKPYSLSKSHKLFKKMIKISDNSFTIHEVIITSPLGLVPRELELVYPASSYDIPVTGVWDEDEKKMIRNLLELYLKNNSYEKIIAHIPKEILEFSEDLLNNPIKTCVDHPTSKKSLNCLEKNLNNHLSKINKINSQKRLIEDFESFASYQFGKNISKILLKDCIVRGKYPYKKIFYKNKQLGMIVFERGLISLTIDGAKRIANSKKYWVEIFDDFTLKGSIFAPGVKDAYNEIRKGDEVIVFQKNKLCAVGVAQMNGEEMKESSYGEAVKVRHKV